jgi:hypothetical protein
MRHVLLSVASCAFVLLLARAEAQTLLRDVNAQPVAPDPFGSNPTQFARFGSRVVFRASDSARGAQLWITDGTSGGT